MNNEILETVSNNHQEEETPIEKKETQEEPDPKADKQGGKEKKGEQKRENPKTKRGRPTVYAREYGRESGENLKKSYGNLWTQYAPGSRSLTNIYYILEGISIARKAVGAENADKMIFKDDRPGGRMKYQGIWEQIGRMKLQNHLDEETCQHQVKYALEMLEHGATCHAIAKRLRWYRNLDESDR